MSRKNWFVSVLVLAALLLSGCQPVMPVATNAAPAVEVETTLDGETVASIEALVAETMAENDLPGVALGIVVEGQVAFAKGYGLAQADSDRPMTPDTLFTVASLSKEFTALAVMQLVEQGRIDLDAPVTDYLPYFRLASDTYTEITIRHLMANASGLDRPDFATAYDYTLRETSAAALEAYVRSLATRELAANPADWYFIYTNDNWDILGDVIAKVTGQPFETYMTKNILTPLGMQSSTFLRSTVDPARLTANHWHNADGALEYNAGPPNFDPIHTPSGGLITNVADMMRWSMLNLNRGELDGVRLVGTKAYDAMWTPHTEINWGMGGPFQDWGLGWVVADEQGHPLYWWGGTYIGSNAMLFVAPADGVGVFIAVNGTASYSEDAPWYSYDIGYPVLQMLLGVEPAASAAPAAPATPAELEAETVAEIETLVEEMMARTKLPGFALGIVKGGELVYAKGFGVTSLDGGEPVTPQTIFLWAENSMAPTAMAVLQLVEQGKIDLDAPVTGYLPYFRMKDATYADITIRHLLMNTSGIPDSGDTMADWENFMPEYDAGAVERWVRSLADTGLLFAPGAGFEYSAPGYALLGAVVGTASGQTYEEYMSENILGPLGMDKSTFLLEEVDKTLLSSPHVQDASGEMSVAKALPYHRPFAAANNLFANVEDMAKLAQASLNRGILDGQRILPESAFEQMWKPHSPTPFADFPFGQIYPAKMMIDWGYGWFIGDIAGHVAPNTLGNEYGFSAEMALAPDANVAVIAVGNGPPIDEYYAADMVADVMSILLK